MYIRARARQQQAACLYYRVESPMWWRVCLVGQIDDLSWEKIERVMHMSRSTVHRVHASALRNFRVPD